MSVEELVAEARAETGNVLALSVPPAAPQPVHRSRRRVLAVTAVSIVFTLIGGFAWWHSQQPDVYATTVGEQRVVTLADGSVVRLNARSMLTVKFTDGRRAVQLLEGQALFQVAKDVHRPFTVASDGSRVQAVGTEFDVRRKRASLVVTVVEGRVAVFGVPAASAPVYVSAGEQVTMSSAGPGRTKPVDPATATAWTRRQLVFEATPLVDVVEEFNRYNTRRLVIRDPALESFQVDGVFSSPDPAPLIRFLRSKPEIRVLETESEILIGEAR